MNAVKYYMIASGNASSVLEHAVPERLFSTTDTPAQGISAVKALKIANDQGVPIYTVNQSNINSILPQLQVSEDTKTDIVNAINAGNFVTISKTNINYAGWIGCGYIISDPVTGAGAYMISGGLHGMQLINMAFKALWGILFFVGFFGGLIMGLPFLAGLLFTLGLSFFGFFNGAVQSLVFTGSPFNTNFLQRGIGIMIGVGSGWFFSQFVGSAILFSAVTPAGWAIALALLVIMGLDLMYNL